MYRFVVNCGFLKQKVLAGKFTMYTNLKEQIHWEANSPLGSQEIPCILWDS